MIKCYRCGDTELLMVENLGPTMGLEVWSDPTCIQCMSSFARGSRKLGLSPRDINNFRFISSTSKEVGP